MEWKYKGYTCTLLGTSHNCPKLKLYGYRDEIQLNRAINKVIKKKAK